MEITLQMNTSIDASFRYFAHFEADSRGTEMDGDHMANQYCAIVFYLNTLLIPRSIGRGTDRDGDHIANQCFE
jgi:hypothetical protein